MVKLTFIGSGSAFTVGEDNFHSNAIIESSSGKRLLIDCGSDTRWALQKLGLSYKDIDAVYISHLHADHVGGLEWLGLTRKFDPQCCKPDLYICDAIAQDLWNHTLSGGMRTLECRVADIHDFFDVQKLHANGWFDWEGLRFSLVQTVHVVSGFEITPSFGLMFEAGNKNIYFTTDTQFAPSQLESFYNMADLVFQDCETATARSGVHAHYQQLLQLEPSIRKKMWLYHYNPGKLPSAKKDGFLGFVKRGQVFEFGHVQSKSKSKPKSKS
ncbi:MAG: MBL fold metallo-hydrolase [Myxococcota bacterium]